MEDTYVAYGDGQKTHFGIAAHRRGSGAPVQLRAIVFLRTDTTTHSDRVPIPEVVRDLWSASFYLSEDDARAACFQGVVALATSTPAWNIRRPLEMTTLEWVVWEIESILSRQS